MKISKVIFHIKPIPSHPWWECKNIFSLTNQWKLTDSTVKNIFSLTDQWKLTDLIVKYIFFAGESVNKQITNSIGENWTDSDLGSMIFIFILWV